MANWLLSLSLQEMSAWAGIGINFLFNVANYRRTNAVRNASLELEEFKRLRGGVDTALAKMREHKSTLRSLEASGASGARLKKDVADCNKCISDCYNSLEDALTDLNRSTLIKGGDWSECTSSAWDDFYTAINATYVREKDLADTKVAIKRSVLKLETLIGAVQERMDQELRRHKA